MFDFAQQEGKGREGKGIGGRTCVMLSGCEEPGEDLRVAARPAVGDSGREWRRRRKEKVKASEERKRVALAAVLGRRQHMSERSGGFCPVPFPPPLLFGSIKELMTGPPVVN